MKILLHTDFFADYMLVETSDLDDLKKYVLNMLDGYELDPSKHKILGDQDSISTEDALKRADDRINVMLSDFEEEIGYVETYYEGLALSHAEHYGIYSYEQKGNLMKWYSYFGSEGIYKVTLNLDTFEEVRKHQNTTKHEYNYFCG